MNRREIVKIWISVFMIALASCTSWIAGNPSPFSVESVTDSISVPIVKHMLPGKYYQVKFDSVNGKFENLAYMGTNDGYNIFAVYSKLDRPEWVTRIALSDSQCEVQDKRTIETEFSIYKLDFRNALDWKGKCVVFGDSIMSRFRKGYRGNYSEEEWYSRWKQAIGN
jgi:hypothetical protein